MQASAIPCQWVFSSGDGYIAPFKSFTGHDGDLQILKFIYWNDHLSFTDDLLSTEQELSVIDISAEVVKDLVSWGKVDQLVALVESSLDGAHPS